MKKLRLLLFEECNRSCDGCCNNDWNLNELPVDHNYNDYEIIMLTGGEPLLNPSLVVKTTQDIKRKSQAQVFLYTAMAHNVSTFANILKHVDGITLTLHERKDKKTFERLCRFLLPQDVKGKSMRLNVFKGINVKNVPEYWQVKDNIKWVKDMHLPKDETLGRL